MTPNNRPSAPDATAPANGPRRAILQPAPRRNAQLILDAVVASYIHQISERHGHRQPASDPMAATATGGS
jgi:hypothetical protein